MAAKFRAVRQPYNATYGYRSKWWDIMDLRDPMNIQIVSQVYGEKEAKAEAKRLSDKC